MKILYKIVLECEVDGEDPHTNTVLQEATNEAYRTADRIIMAADIGEVIQASYEVAGQFNA
jgi:hypothetical protein